MRCSPDKHTHIHTHFEVAAFRQVRETAVRFLVHQHGLHRDRISFAGAERHLGLLLLLLGRFQIATCQTGAVWNGMGGRLETKRD